MLHQQALTLLAILAVLLTGCRKDEDETPPSVRILAPTAGFQVSVPTMLPVVVEVADDRAVKGLTVTLGDVNGVPIVPSVAVDLDTRSATLTVQLSVANERLTSGSYTLTARATDGTNDARAFASVAVQEAPLRLRALFILPAAGSTGTVPVMRLDSAGNQSTWTTLSELGGSAIDPDNLYISGIISQPLRALPVGNTPPWSVPNNAPTGSTDAYFAGLALDPYDARLYHGTSDGTIRGHGPQGQQTFTAQSPSGYRSQRTAVLGPVLASAAWEPVTGDRRIVTHALPGGQVLAQFPLDMDVSALFRRNDQQVYAVGNRDGGGVVRLIDVQQGGQTDVRSFIGDPLHSVVRTDNATLILGLGSGIVRLDVTSANVSPLVSGAQADALAWEPATGTLYAGIENILQEFDPTNGTSLGSTVLPFPIGNIHPLLNR